MPYRYLLDPTQTLKNFFSPKEFEMLCTCLEEGGERHINRVQSTKANGNARLVRVRRGRQRFLFAEHMHHGEPALIFLAGFREGEHDQYQRKLNEYSNTTIQPQTVGDLIDLQKMPVAAAAAARSISPVFMDAPFEMCRVIRYQNRLIEPSLTQQQLIDAEPSPHGICVIGTAGTGKTMAISELIQAQLARLDEAEVILCFAPGKVCQLLKETLIAEISDDEFNARVRLVYLETLLPDGSLAMADWYESYNKTHKAKPLPEKDALCQEFKLIALDEQDYLRRLTACYLPDENKPQVIAWFQEFKHTCKQANSVTATPAEWMQSVNVILNSARIAYCLVDEVQIVPFGVLKWIQQQRHLPVHFFGDIDQATVDTALDQFKKLPSLFPRCHYAALTGSYRVPRAIAAFAQLFLQFKAQYGYLKLFQIPLKAEFYSELNAMGEVKFEQETLSTYVQKIKLVWQTKGIDVNTAFVCFEEVSILKELPLVFTASQIQGLEFLDIVIVVSESLLSILEEVLSGTGFSQAKDKGASYQNSSAILRLNQLFVATTRAQRSVSVISLNSVSERKRFKILEQKYSGAIVLASASGASVMSGSPVLERKTPEEIIRMLMRNGNLAQAEALLETMSPEIKAKLKDQFLLEMRVAQQQPFQAPATIAVAAAAAASAPFSNPMHCVCKVKDPKGRPITSSYVSFDMDKKANIWGYRCSAKKFHSLNQIPVSALETIFIKLSQSMDDYFKKTNESLPSDQTFVELSEKRKKNQQILAAASSVLPSPQVNSARASAAAAPGLSQGAGTARVESAEVRAYRVAAKGGNAMAQHNLAVSYQTGIGIEKNEGEAVRWFRKAAEQGLAQAQYALGFFYQSKDDRKAMHYYRLAAEQGHAAAQNNLGCLYDRGLGEEDKREAVRWYRAAAEQGVVGVRLAMCCENGIGTDVNYVEAAHWYELAAEQGDASAQNNLSRFYQMGIGVVKDEQLAMRWLKAAAAQGLANAQCALGHIYERGGEGVIENKSEAERLYRLAAGQGFIQAQDSLDRLLRRTQYEALLALRQSTEQGASAVATLTESAEVSSLRAAAERGDAVAQYTMGSACAQGKGTPQNNLEAMRWFQLAAEQKHPGAQFELGCCHRDGVGGFTKNEHVAVNWYRLAAEQGFPQAQHSLGGHYENGTGVAQDAVEAVRWYRLAAAQEHASSQHSLGWCYENGIGVAKDAVEAVRWYRLAVEQGCADAQHNLGVCYLIGKGISKDASMAVSLFQLAAEQGNERAQCNLGICYEKGRGVSQDERKAVRWYRLAAGQRFMQAQVQLDNLLARFPHLR